MQWPKRKKSRDSEPQDKSPALPLRLQRLARKLDELPELDRKRIAETAELEWNQRAGALELYDLCRGFVEVLNGALDNLKLELSPAEFDPSQLDHASGVLHQINANGRIVQLAVLRREAEANSEHYRREYILEGRVQWFNQELLDTHNVLESQIFYCVDKTERGWRYYDPRSRKGGTLDRDFLAEALEQLL